MFLTINKLEFSLLSDSESTRRYADRLAEVYAGRTAAIAEFLLADEGFCTFFPDVNKEQVAAGLGVPLFTLLSDHDGVVTFPEAKFKDQGHLVSFEFSGELSDFFDLSIDG